MPHSDEVLSRMQSTTPPFSVSVPSSPFTYTATDAGVIVLQGGTATLVELGRKGIFVNVGVLVGPIYLSKGDQLRITYSAASPVTSFYKAS